MEHVDLVSVLNIQDGPKKLHIFEGPVSMEPLKIH